MIRHTSGVVCVPMPASDLDRLDLPPMTVVNQDRKKTAYTVSVDARDGVSTGISAADRAHTIKVLVDSATEPWELTRPGHVFPLRAVEGGVLRRPGHTEASVDLAQLAGLTPAGVICEVVNEDGTMSRLPELVEFAREHDLALISIEDLITYRRRLESRVVRLAVTRLPTVGGEFQAYAYADRTRDGLQVPDGDKHVALVEGVTSPGVGERPGPHPLRVGLTGDAFASLRCDCGVKLQFGADPDRDRGPGDRRLPARARGPRDRAGPQAAGLRVAGRRPRHRRRQPAARAARGRPGLRGRGTDPSRPRGPLGPADRPS